MDDLSKKHLSDILDSIDAIGEHFGTNAAFEEYLRNKTVRRAIEREMEIIGEAVGKLLKIHPDVKISSARKIIGMRNLLAHAYGNVDNKLVSSWYGMS